MSKRIKPTWAHGNVTEDSPNKVFCTAPWTHTYISPQSERRMCCASRSNTLMLVTMKAQVNSKTVVLYQTTNQLV